MTCPPLAPIEIWSVTQQALESAFAAAGHLVARSPPDAARDALAGLAMQALQILRDGDLPGQLHAAGRGLTAVLAAPQPSTSPSGAHAAAEHAGTAEYDEGSSSSAGSLNAIRRGVAGDAGAAHRPGGAG